MATRNTVTSRPTKYPKPEAYLHVVTGVSWGATFDHTTDSFTWIGQVRIGAGTTGYILKKGGEAANGFILYVHATGVLTANVYCDAADHYTTALSTATSVKDNKWHSFAFVVDRSGTGIARIYVDGVLNASTAALGAESITSGGNMVVTPGGTKSFDIANYGYYNRALTAAEILRIHNGEYITEGLTGYYPMNEGLDTSVLTTTPVIYPTVGTIKGTPTLYEYRVNSILRPSSDDDLLLRLGVFADLQHGIGAGGAQDRKTLLEGAITEFNQNNCDMVIGLGDIVEGVALTSEADMYTYIDEVEVELAKSTAVGGRRIILGNHDDDSTAMTMAESVARFNSHSYTYIPSIALGKNYWSEDLNGVHLVFLWGREVATVYPTIQGTDDPLTAENTTVTLSSTAGLYAPGFIYVGTEIITFTNISGNTLNGCVRGAFGTTAATHAVGASCLSDGEYYRISPTQQSWLINDLNLTVLPTIIFIHQRIDQDYPGADRSGTRFGFTVPASGFPANANEVRTIIERYPRVKLVLCGHEHTNHYVKKNNIHYVVMEALGEATYIGGNFGILDFYESGSFQIDGRGVQMSYSKR